MAHVLTREPTRDDVGSDPRRPPVDLRHVAEVRDVREPVREHTSGTGRGIGDRDQLDAVTTEHGLQAEARGPRIPRTTTPREARGRDGGSRVLVLAEAPDRELPRVTLEPVPCGEPLPLDGLGLGLGERRGPPVVNAV